MQELNSLISDGWPSYGASMAAGSTLTEKTHDQLATPGSPSEQTNGVDAKHGTTPDLDIPAASNDTKTAKSGGNYDAAMQWKTVK
jgi:hypothetical protein